MFLQASQNPEFKSVWQIPRGFEIRDGWFNASLSFPSSELAVATDGGGVLHIIDTNIRTSANSHIWEVHIFHLVFVTLLKDLWFIHLFLKVKLSNEILGSREPFKIIHSNLNTEETNQSETLSVLVLKVESIGTNFEETIFKYIHI